MSGLVDWAEQELKKIETQIEEKVGTLLADRDNLTAELKKLKRGSGGATSTVDSVPVEDIVKAVGELTASGEKSTVSSPDIAGHLGVDVRKIARKTAKMGSDGELITGDKESGYALA